MTRPVTQQLERKDLRAGVALILLAMTIIPAMDTIAKHLTGSLSPGQVSAARFVFQSLILLPIIFAFDSFGIGRNLLKHVARGLLMVCANTTFFLAFQHMPLADTVAIYFVEPLILTILAAVLLKEHVGWRRLVAVVIGLAGAMMIIQPTFTQFGAIALLPLLTALSFALYLILTRTLTHDTGTFAMQFYVGVFGTAAIVPVLLIGDAAGFAPLLLKWPTPGEWGWLFALGAVGTSAHLLIVQAIRRMGAGLVAPFQYLEIVGATIFGYFVFGDFPGVAVWGGVAVIVGAGLYVFYREHKA